MSHHAIRCGQLRSYVSRYVLTMRLRQRFARIGKVIIAAGEWITCTRGHRICKAADDIVGGTVIKQWQFSDWREGMDPAGTHGRIWTVPCVTCRSPWLKNRFGHLHIEGKGWV